ncbi:MAG: glycoside hydrolase family 32 protein [Solobacterium sp.]|nr:glycoside hydrolase family 32 protein [Solobacterium sp.]
MNSHILLEAREFEERESAGIPEETRPVFHLTPKVGWMNDPNGFSQYKGQYHLFYQYYPYQKKWGPMHWGHAVSEDLLKWKYLPAALAPDTEPDAGGCFSGSAVTLDDGRHLLMYTGVIKLNDIQEDIFFQSQCVAVGDGIDYEKYPGNPVIEGKDISDGASKYDFRDPKIWREPDGTFRCVCVTCPPDQKYENRRGRVVWFRSDDGFKWEYIGVLAENDGTLGTMWECPDFFELDGKHILLLSPQDLIENNKYYSGNITVWMSGTFDRETGKYTVEKEQLADYGIDFYATQTLLAEDGRRIMIGWMQNWDSITFTRRDLRWSSQMTLPRELSFKDGKLIQKPVRELEAHRANPLIIRDNIISNKTEIEGVRGRLLDITIEIKPVFESSYRKFEMRFAEDGETYTSLVYRPNENTLEFDRSFSQTRRAVVNDKKFKVANRRGNLKIRLILDKFSCEAFINDGEQTMSNVILTDMKADRISFSAHGGLLLSIEKYDLVFE